jgi:hypothetical protein
MRLLIFQRRSNGLPSAFQRGVPTPPPYTASAVRRRSGRWKPLHGRREHAMSTLKTPDNATLHGPMVSPGREIRRQEARRSKGVATAQMRGAPEDRKGPPGLAKKRTMWGAPKRELKVDKPKKPYRLTPEENQAKIASWPLTADAPPCPRSSSVREASVRSWIWITTIRSRLACF